jgi:hypothetical protein
LSSGVSSGVFGPDFCERSIRVGRRECMRCLKK